MRIVMPLFEFECSGIERYAFGDCDIAIEPFEKSEALKLPIFSEQINQWGQTRLIFD